MPMVIDLLLLAVLVVFGISLWRGTTDQLWKAMQS